MFNTLSARRGQLAGLVMAAAVLLATAQATAGDLGVYREHRLGATTSEVISRLDASPSDLVVLHQRPALLQELSWRPPYVINQAPGSRDSVATIVFSFVDDRLFKIAVQYDKSQTEGLTRSDMIAALSVTYGPSAGVSTPRRPAFDTIDQAVRIAQWRDDDVLVVLQESPYRGVYGLVLTSVTLEAAAAKAQASAIAMDLREAPARDAARARAAEAAAREAAGKTRRENQGAFKP